MWVAKFMLRDDEDIYSPLCEKYNVSCHARPLTHYESSNFINLLLSGSLSGTEENIKGFVRDLKKDKRILSVEKHHEFILVHARHHISREARAEIKLFYDPQFIHVKPILLDTNGWEHWHIASIDREVLNRIVRSAQKTYHGKLMSLKKETISHIATTTLTPHLTEQQLAAIRSAHKEGYYEYPRRITLPELAKISKKSYSTFQEHLSKAENKLIEHFIKYR